MRQGQEQRRKTGQNAPCHGLPEAEPGYVRYKTAAFHKREEGIDLECEGCRERGCVPGKVPRNGFSRMRVRRKKMRTSGQKEHSQKNCCTRVPADCLLKNRGESRVSFGVP